MEIFFLFYVVPRSSDKQIGDAQEASCIEEQGL